MQTSRYAVVTEHYTEADQKLW